MRGGDFGMMLRFNGDSTQVETIMNNIQDYRTDLKKHINYLFVRLDPTPFNRDGYWGYSSQYANTAQFNEIQRGNHIKAIRNLQKIISAYNIPSFTIYDGLSGLPPMPRNEGAIYKASSGDIEDYD
jgi:hypothetical protein